MMFPQDSNYWKNRPLTDEKRDWAQEGKTWVDDYTLSVNHPHRNGILNLLALTQTHHLLEVGCNSGPNLMRIAQQLPQIKLAGIDINADAIEAAKNNLQWIENLKVASITEIPFGDKSFDTLLSDAVLIYVTPEEIVKVMDEFDRIVQNTIILCEWYDPNSTLGVLNEYHWARNYLTLLIEKGFTNLYAKKLTAEEWPSSNWIKNGWLYAASRQA